MLWGLFCGTEPSSYARRAEFLLITNIRQNTKNQYIALLIFAQKSGRGGKHSVRAKVGFDCGKDDYQTPRVASLCSPSA